MMLYPDRSFWFLWVLFWICVIFNLVQLVASKLEVNEMVLILSTCLLLFGVMVVMEIRVLGFQFLAYYFLFYTLGYFLHKYEDSLLLKVLNKPVSIMVLVALWAFLAWGWSMHGLPLWIPAIPHVPSAIMQYTYRGITALLAIVILIGIAPKILNGKDKMNQWVCSFGIVSLGLYVCHLLVMDYIVHFLKTMFPSFSLWTCVAVTFFTVLPLSYIIVWLLSKNKFSNKIFFNTSLKI